MITWPFVCLIGVLVFGVVVSLWLAYMNNCDEREHLDRLREMQDEIDGIVR